jgi:hypothetical protein
MKKAILLITVIFLGVNLFAQEENRNPQEYRTLFGGDETSHGGYGGLSVNYTQIDGKDAVMVGARGAWVINHGVALGIAGYGFANDMNYEKTINNITADYLLAGGYGGLLIEPIIGAKWPVHVSIPILIGAGGVAYVNQYWNNYNDPYYHDPYKEDASAFFVLEPGIEIELNMVKFMRLAIGGYYRYTSGLDLADSKSNILDGFSTGITLKFGKF